VLSVFLEVPVAEWVASNALAFAFRDRFPVSPGHTLVVTRRVVADWFAASDDERLAVLRLVEVVKAALDEEHHPDGYNVGFNAGQAAGQTVMHLHLHVIPRYRGDMDDPRGGVRHVIPSKGNYLREVAPLATGGEHDPFARHVLPLLGRATDIAIVAAFVQESGLERLRPALHGALARGARVRIVTGDYLEITQVAALETLLDWQRTSIGEGDDEVSARFEARVVEVGLLPGRTRSFHPKSWIFMADGLGVAFVGSSNLSRSALDTGIEWNLRVDRDRDAAAFQRILAAFQATWDGACRFDAAWIEAYARRARAGMRQLPPGEVETEEPEVIPEPHEVQVEALAALRKGRDAGRRRALVVLATGLGKTWLAAFDYRALREESGTRPRLLFLAHRRELLRQAASSYRRLLRVIDPAARVGWFTDEESDLSADLVFASVAKLARRENVDKLRAQRFDYVVVDEVHHAAADSYRRILAALDPGFLLGLTATPDRADAADILGLFDDFVAYRADIARGVELRVKSEGQLGLVPFHYFGVKDDIDYDHIPWRNRRFDTEALALAAQTEARMETLWRAWNEHPGARSLIFCCSIAHASHVRTWLGTRAVRVAAVYSGAGSDDRDGALRALASGELDALCAVDVFNEGVDVPSIDRVIMLRPTESSVVFLQQLGRGLRASPGKSAVTVIDFVGNHRVFLERVRALLALAGGAATSILRGFLDAEGAEELPAGCSVDLELEAKALLQQFFKIGGTDEVERAYRELHLERGERPSAGEMQRLGYPPGRLRERHGSWFDFVRSENHLGAEQLRVLDIAGSFLREVETTEMTKCFKMVTLAVLIEEGALLAGLPLRDLALRSHALLRRSPELHADIAEDERAAPTDAVREKRWLAYWRRNPIEAWTSSKRERRTWFRLTADRFVLDLAIDPVLAPVLADLTNELVDYRLAEYRARKRQGIASPEGFVCRITWNQRDPILKLPPRRGSELPFGETDVRLSDGRVWQFRFAKEFCNVARPAGVQVNELPELLRRWFGPQAGQPGTAFEVRFHASPDGLWVEPLRETVVPFARRRGIVAYPDLRAAAGHVQGAVESPEQEQVMLPLDVDDPSLFAVRVSGTSMDGGASPLRDGDWAVFHLARSAAGNALTDRVVLVQVPGEPFGSQYQIKRLRRRGEGWLLTSDNPAGPTIAPRDDMVVIARLDRAVRPEELGPAVGTVIEEARLSEQFGLVTLPATSGRHGGHLFIFIDRQGMLEGPDRVRYVASPQRPGETAFMLARREDGAWRYLGVARQLADEGAWNIPEVDLATWRMWGEGREVSRRLPEGALARAQLAVSAILALAEDARDLVQGDGHRAHVLGAAARGGLRISGGEGRFAERTVSLQDLGWVIVAAEDAREQGGALDEARVNRLRYLEGTPKGSTRWIDTGWALAAWALAKDRVSESVGADTPLVHVHDASGKALDATFRLERLGEALTIIFESRGGTRGSSAERNTDYNTGLEVLLGRIGALGLKIADVLVESRATADLSPERRRVTMEGESFPLVVTDPAGLRRKLSAAQALIGRAEGAKGGGNQTRRLRIFVTGERAGSSTEAILRALERPPAAG
jgi:superfamily II DNA or RNA helicase/diadenosine tetraphosphate (Ap4A) HIT family hydrolase/SOS-response transcriptional repressor LexA